MDFEITSTLEPEFLRIKASGQHSMSAVLRFIAATYDLARQNGRSRVLMDCRPIAGNMTEVERFQSGQEIARVFGSRIKAALIMPPSQITKLGELSAINRGANVLVTDSEAEARIWLLAGAA